MRVLACILLVLMAILPAKAQPLTIVTEEFPPYNFSQDGVPQGLSTEVVEAVLQKIGFDAKIEFLPWARAYLTAQNRKNTLIYSIGRIPEREDLFEWVGVIAPFNTSLYTRADNTGVSIASLNDAKRYSIGVSVKDVIYQYLDGEGFKQLDVVGEDVLNIRKLALGRIDIIAFDEASFNYRVALEGMDMGTFRRVYRLEEISGSLYMAFSKTSDPELVAAFREGLAAIRSDGTYEQILARYALMN
ncbi:transporter substrate-binding domain-containing protein [Roseibium denhamense]|nr:transporter substrate-binding domain-containing protein [Roseibium denhamense]MTI05808.1 transporter substrate-binding domain-containing protein [Roseibium denhamense]